MFPAFAGTAPTLPSSLQLCASAVCVRLLRAISGRDHRHAEDQRKTSRTQRASKHARRATRLSRAAAIAETRAAELAHAARAGGAA